MTASAGLGGAPRMAEEDMVQALHRECAAQACRARRYPADVRIQPHADVLTAMVTAHPALLVAGIGTGSIYALIALGFNVVFKSTGAMNFAQGEWVVMGGMVSALLFSAFSKSDLPALLRCWS